MRHGLGMLGSVRSIGDRRRSGVTLLELIKEARGVVGLTNGAGFIRRYSYGRCPLDNPPPYFPTSGRFVDNRFYEIDPVSFTVAQLIAQLTVSTP